MIHFRPFKNIIGGFCEKDSKVHSPQIQNFVLLKQVHGDQIHVLDSGAQKDSVHLQEGDALLCFEKNIPIAVKTADCVPILLAHPDGLIGAVHAGWRGTRLKILKKVLIKIRDEFKKDLSKIHLAIGPAICGKCYEVGEEVAREFDSKYFIQNSNGKFLLNLKKLNFDMAIQAGIPQTQIQVMEDCTLCKPEIYHSYRYESQHGLSKEGRNYSWVMLE